MQKIAGGDEFAVRSVPIGIRAVTTEEEYCCNVVRCTFILLKVAIALINPTPRLVRVSTPSSRFKNPQPLFFSVEREAIRMELDDPFRRVMDVALAGKLP
jgi:hypothetical protein